MVLFICVISTSEVLGKNYMVKIYVQRYKSKGYYSFWIIYLTNWMKNSELLWN